MSNANCCKSAEKNRAHVKAHAGRNPGLNGLTKLITRLKKAGGYVPNESTLRKYALTSAIVALIRAGEVTAAQHYATYRAVIIEFVNEDTSLPTITDVTFNLDEDERPVPPAGGVFTWAEAKYVYQHALNRKTRDILGESTRKGYIDRMTGSLKALNMWFGDDDNTHDILPIIADFHGTYQKLSMHFTPPRYAISTFAGHIKSFSPLIRESPKLQKLLLDKESEAARLWSKAILPLTQMEARAAIKRNENTGIVPWADLLKLGNTYEADTLERTLFVLQTELTRRYVYHTCKIVDKWENIPDGDDKGNFYIMSERTLVLQTYKTAHAYGRFTYQFSAKAHNTIKKGLKKHPRDYLIQRDEDVKNGKPMSVNSYSEFFKKVFGVGVQIVRRSRVTDFHLKNLGVTAREELARLMGHSTSVATTVYSHAGHRTEEEIEQEEEKIIESERAQTRSMTRSLLNPIREIGPSGKNTEPAETAPRATRASRKKGKGGSRKK